jgi:predicted DNA-binding transcriptional regulator AlpA
MTPSHSSKARDGQSRGSNPQPLDAARHSGALLHVRTVCALAGLSASSIYRKVAAREFPEPVRLGRRCTRWRAGDVTAWLAQVGS